MNNKRLFLKLSFILDNYIVTSIKAVSDDSQEDPHHSAVATDNVIYCYISIMNRYHKPLPYDDIDSCMSFYRIPEKERKSYKRWRKKEETYYRSEIYSLKSAENKSDKELLRFLLPHVEVHLGHLLCAVLDVKTTISPKRLMEATRFFLDLARDLNYETNYTDVTSYLLGEWFTKEEYLLFLKMLNTLKDN